MHSGHGQWSGQSGINRNLSYLGAASDPAQTKSLIVEKSSLAGWIRRMLPPYVNTWIVCDQQHNALIRRGNKHDGSDAMDLCRLLRLEDYHEVYHGDEDPLGLILRSLSRSM